MNSERNPGPEELLKELQTPPLPAAEEFWKEFHQRCERLTPQACPAPDRTISFPRMRVALAAAAVLLLLLALPRFRHSPPIPAPLGNTVDYLSVEAPYQALIIYQHLQDQALVIWIEETSI